ncbi:MAG: hypothetical protein Q8N17_26360 [Burkholderiaceae bacterium]|nr:hypothetical protein [Burkholderiaceae bacterium]
MTTAAPQPAPSAQPRAVPAQNLTGDVAWLWTHCRALGMTRKSESGSLRDDVALFVADLHDAAQKAAVPAQVVEAMTDKIAEMLRGTYHCTRVWQAWNVGTMTEDDFEPVEESDTPREVAEAIAALIAQPPAATTEATKCSLTLTGAEVLALAEFVIPDCIDVRKLDGDATQFVRETVADELASTVTVEHCPDRTGTEGEHMPAGFYAWMADYPEEGCIPLAATTEGATK